MTPDTDFSLGRHEALIEQLVSGQTQIFERLGDIENILAEQKGERRFVAGAWGVIGGTVVAALTAFFKAHLGAQP